MANIEKKFPKDFLWGTATSAYQVEGGIGNNDWANSKKTASAGRACDHYNQYDSDFQIAKELEHNAHRISIEWSRIQPVEGEFDEKEIEHYRQVLLNLREKGMKTFVTLHHFTNPTWIAEQGGWANKKTTEDFDQFVEKTAERLGDLVDFWITINEPNIYVYMGYLQGFWPPFKKNYLKAFSVYRNMLKAHNLAHKTIHKQDPAATVGLAQNIGWHESALKRFFYNLTNVTFPFRMVKIDFIGLNHYFYWPASDKKKKELQYTDKDWVIYPRAIFLVLEMLKKYRKPIYITENGLADKDDDQREEYIRGYLAEVHRAISKGANVKGYLHWSLMDNYEWPVKESETGYESKFGLVEVDFSNLSLKRRVRPSAYKYAEICKNNSL